MDQEAMLSILAGMKEYFDRSTRVLDEADSTFIPAEGMFTAAQVVAHVAQTVDWFFHGVFDGFDMDFGRMDKEVRATTSLEAAKKRLEQVYGDAISAVKAHSVAEWSATLPEGPILGGRPRFEMMGALMDHTAHHRGALTVYSRLRGKVPAMPYMEA
jgi:uncharacterized damage-inducible protein DinB